MHLFPFSTNGHSTVTASCRLPSIQNNPQPKEIDPTNGIEAHHANWIDVSIRSLEQVGRRGPFQKGSEAIEKAKYQEGKRNHGPRKKPLGRQLTQRHKHHECAE